MTAEHITTQQAAKLLGCTPRYICYLCREGNLLGAAKKAGAWLIPSALPTKSPENGGRIIRTRRWVMKKTEGRGELGSRRIRDYVLCHLGEVARRTGELTDDITELLTHPGRQANPEGQLKLARMLARENLKFLARGFDDLCALEGEND